MRIGIDCRMYSSSFTGIGRYVFELTKNIFEIDLINEYVLFFNEPEFSKFKIPNKRVKKALVGARHYSWKEQTLFLQKLNKENLDLMHFTHFNAPLFYRRPSIVTIHDLTLSFFPGKKMTSWIHRLGYFLTIRSITKRSKKIISVSRNTKNDLIKLFKIPSKKIKVIYEGVGGEFLSKENSNYISNKINQEFLLYTGVWREHKNLLGLIKSFDILVKKRGFNGQLVITGKEDTSYPEIKNSVKKLGLENLVIFTGWVKEGELIALYKRAKMFVFPSFYEGFGLPLLESFATELPIVCSNTSCLPEIAGKGNIDTFDPKNIYEMADTIYDLWKNKNRRELLIKRGKNRLKNFSWKKMSKETKKEYEFIKN